MYNTRERRLMLFQLYFSKLKSYYGFSFFQEKICRITYFLHCLICSGFGYSFRHSVIWSPILIRHCLVCSSCSLSERPFSGRSSCFNAALTGLILSLHCKMEKKKYINSKGKKILKHDPPLLCYLYRQKQY